MEIPLRIPVHSRPLTPIVVLLPFNHKQANVNKPLNIQIVIVTSDLKSIEKWRRSGPVEEESMCLRTAEGVEDQRIEATDRWTRNPRSCPSTDAGGAPPMHRISASASPLHSSLSPSLYICMYLYTHTSIQAPMSLSLSYYLLSLSLSLTL